MAPPPQGQPPQDAQPQGQPGAYVPPQGQYVPPQAHGQPVGDAALGVPQAGAQPAHQAPPEQQGYAPQQGQPPGYVPAQGQPPQYVPPQGQYVPQQGQYAQPQPPRKKKFPKWLAVVAIIAAVVVVAAILGISATGKAADRDFFKIGADEVPSVKLALGEKRDISNLKTGTTETGREMVINYKVSEGQGDDMGIYAKALMDDYGYINTTPYDFTGSRGSGFEFAKESVMDGYVVLVRIDYDTSGYDLTLMVSAGELIVDEPPDDPGDPGDIDDDPGDVDDPGPTDPPPAQDGQVEILIPAEFFFRIDKDAIVEEAMYVGYECNENSDGSITLIMSEQQQDALVREYKTHIDDIITSILQEPNYNIEDIQVSSDYTAVTIICGEDFGAYESWGSGAVVALGYFVPLHLIYQGKGADSTTTITLIDAGSGETLNVIECPYGLHDNYDW